VLYVRRGTRNQALHARGAPGEQPRRAGTENVPTSSARPACELAALDMDEENTRVGRLRDKLQAGILKTCLDVRVNGDARRRLPTPLNVSFEYIEGEAILYALSDLGIALPRGSRARPAPWNLRMCCGRWGCRLRRQRLGRFSLSRYTWKEDIDYVIQHIPEAVNACASCRRSCRIRSRHTTMSRDREPICAKTDRAEVPRGVRRRIGKSRSAQGHRISTRPSAATKRVSNVDLTLTRMCPDDAFVW